MENVRTLGKNPAQLGGVGEGFQQSQLLTLPLKSSNISVYIPSRRKAQSQRHKKVFEEVEPEAQTGEQGIKQGSRRKSMSKSVPQVPHTEPDA